MHAIKQVIVLSDGAFHAPMQLRDVEKNDSDSHAKHKEANEEQKLVYESTGGQLHHEEYWHDKKEMHKLAYHAKHDLSTCIAVKGSEKEVVQEYTIKVCVIIRHRWDHGDVGQVKQFHVVDEVCQVTLLVYS